MFSESVSSLVADLLSLVAGDTLRGGDEQGIHRSCTRRCIRVDIFV